MTCSMAISDELQCDPVSSRDALPVLTEKPEILVWFPNPPGLHAIDILSSEAPSLLPLLQPFLSPEPGPVPFLRRNGEVESRKEFGRPQPRVLDDLKATIDSLSPTARQQLIAELRTVLAELADAA